MKQIERISVRLFGMILKPFATLLSHGSNRVNGVDFVLKFVALTILASAASQANEPLIGYTRFRTDLRGSRHANVSTMRAMVVGTDGERPRELAPDLARPDNTWTQFASWSPGGATAIIGNGWQDPANALWEEEQKRFRMQPGKWRYDGYLFTLATGQLTDVCGVGRVSHYNSVSFSPDGKRLLMTSLVGGTSKPFLMDLDGANKTDVSGGTDGFTYGFNASPDGKKIAYHEGYQVFIANADGSDKWKVETGNRFNFSPVWSPDGKWILFVSGEHYNCHPHVVRADGTGLRKIADRSGYGGVTLFLDVDDFHGGSSDTPVWSADGSSIFYTAKVGKAIELFQVPLDGQPKRLTQSSDGVTHYHPQPAKDGRKLLYGSNRNGVRQLFIRDLSSGMERQLTNLKKGRAAMWAKWQPIHRPSS